LSSYFLPKNLEIKIYGTIILPVVLYVGETLSLRLREEHRLRVFENMALRTVFGSKREEDAYNEELHNCTLHQILLW
jgi:hypothetical protein